MMLDIIIVYNNHKILFHYLTLVVIIWFQIAVVNKQGDSIIQAQQVSDYRDRLISVDALRADLTLLW